MNFSGHAQARSRTTQGRTDARPITATMHLGAIENNLRVVRRFAPA